MMTPTAYTVWDRVVGPGLADFEPSVARLMLKMRFDPVDVARIEELGEQASAGTLDDEQRAELETYLHVGHMLTLLHAKARASVEAAERKQERGQGGSPDAATSGRRRADSTAGTRKAS